MLQALEKELGRKDDSALIEIAGEQRKIYFDEPLYLEVSGHYTTLHCTNECVTVKKNFSGMVKLLQDGGADLVLCHRSAAVNMEKVVRITQQYCCLSNKTELPVSRGTYQKLNEAFIRINMDKRAGDIL